MHYDVLKGKARLDDRPKVNALRSFPIFEMRSQRSVDPTVGVSDAALSAMGASGDVNSIRSYLRTWTSNRLAHVDKASVAYTTILERATRNDHGMLMVQATDVAEALTARVVDSSGLVHGLTAVEDEAGASQLYLDGAVVAIKGAGETVYTTVSHFAEDKITALSDITDELASEQSILLEFMSNAIDSAEQTGMVSASIITAGLSSTSDAVRELSSTLAQNGSGSLQSVYSFMAKGISGLKSLSSEDSTEDVGYTFNIEDYKFVETKSLLVGTWTVISGVAGLVASIAWIAGGVVAPIVATVIQAGSSLLESLRNRASALVDYQLGSGNSTSFAQASRLYYRVSRSDFPGAESTFDAIQSWVAEHDSEQSCVHTPWGTLCVGQPGNFILEDESDVSDFPLLFYPSCKLNSVLPFFSRGDLENREGIFSTALVSQESYYEWALNYAKQLAADMIDIPMPTDYRDIVQAVIINFGRFLWFMATLGLRPALIEDGWSCSYSDLLDQFVPNGHSDSTATPYRHTSQSWFDVGPKNFDLVTIALASALDYRLMKPLTGMSYTDMPSVSGTGGHVTAYEFWQLLKYASSSVTAGGASQFTASDVWKSASLLISPEEELYPTLSQSPFLAGIISACQRLGTAMQCAVTNQYYLLFTSIAIALSMATGPIGFPLVISGQVSYATFPYVASDDEPYVDSDPYCTPPLIDGRSIMLSAALLIAATITVVVTAVAVKTKVRRWRQKRALRKEQDAIAAQDAYKANPTDKNLDVYLRKQRKFTRYANKVGYSSNNVGSFNLGRSASPEEVSTLLSKISTLLPSDEKNNLDSNVVIMYITGKRFQDVPDGA